MKWSILFSFFLQFVKVSSNQHHQGHEDDEPVPCIPSSHYKLSNDVLMPRVSFGTAGLPRGLAQENIINLAYQAGFRSFDTAQAKEWYDEKAVSNALKDKYKNSKNDNDDDDDIFITTKIHPRDLGYENTKKAIEKSIEIFGNDHPIGLILLHYSRCFIGVCTSDEVSSTEKAGGWKTSWIALNEFVKEGKVRAIGVSNFDLSELKQMNPKPHVVQNWFDPFHQDRFILQYCQNNNIGYTSYSTLGGQWAHQEVQGEGKRRLANPIFESPIIKEIAMNHFGDESLVTMVVLSWALQRGVMVLPRSSSNDHIRENTKLFLKSSEEDNNNSSNKLKRVKKLSVILTQRELELIDALDGSIDRHVECHQWASLGECERNSGYMHESCRSSCKLGNALPLTCGENTVSFNNEDEL